MASDEILLRIDAHMERGNKIMARNGRFLDAVVRRLDAQMRRIDRLTDRFEAETIEARRRSGEITAALRDTRDERRARTQALLRLLDRLSGGGEPDPATG